MIRQLFLSIMLSLEIAGLARFFGPRKIFDNISFTLKKGESMAITGPNGSGKTTLLKIIMGLLTPSKGEVIYNDNGKRLDFERYRRHLALVAPYLTLYDALTAEENLRFLTKIDGRQVEADEIEAVLYRLGLAGRGGDPVAAYSTGMKQRLKYALALLRHPMVWLFDEPTANMDESGKKIILDLIREIKKEVIVVMATNEREEAALVERQCQLGG